MKFWPLLVSPETDTDADPSCISIATGLVEPRLAEFTSALVKLAVPKSVSGRMPPRLVQQGASAMTSAEDRAAPCSCGEVD